jgi:hypothetical protein
VLTHLRNGCVNNADLRMISRKQLRYWNRVPMIDSFEPHFNLKSYTSTFLASCAFRDSASCLCPVIGVFVFEGTKLYERYVVDTCVEVLQNAYVVSVILSDALETAYCHYWLHRGNLHRVYRLSARDLFWISILHAVIVSHKIHCHFCPNVEETLLTSNELAALFWSNPCMMEW